MSGNETEVVLDAEQWVREAEDHIRDIRNHVDEAQVSEKLTSTDAGIHINIKTIEGLLFCVHLSTSGIRVVGNLFDDCTQESDSNEFFETLHALLDKLSPKYRQSFGKELQEKLSRFQEELN
ncbi:GSK3-beta interaction protein-like [Neocloeon triangulifer]|uniref:GSK3-beta interaction protein-like n=1 Tax=Neocloeon triangulifer TaxID=2078957 RepID=UPI00286EC0C8|nr:GSK3-beta interaction protein-like [Neocloeon triangulifer]